MSKATASQKTGIKGDTMADNRVVADKFLELFRNSLKTGSAGDCLRSNPGQALDSIRNGAARGNKCLHLIEDGWALKLDGRDLQDHILLGMEACCLQVQRDTNRWLFTHKCSLRFSPT